MRFEPKPFVRHTVAELIDEIRRVVVHEFEGVPPTPMHFNRVARVKAGTISARFGTYAKAMAAAGFTYTPMSAKFTPEAVKANLSEVLNRAGGYRFTYKFYRQNGGAYDKNTVKSILGLSWNGILAAIGAKPRPHILKITPYAQRCRELAQLTEADLFNEISRVWEVKGRRPTFTEFGDASRFGTEVYRNRYGSWIKALEAYCKSQGTQGQRQAGANATAPRGWRVTREILLADLRAIQSKRPGDSLSYERYKNHGGTYAITTFRVHFGSWTNAVQNLGHRTGRQAKYSIDELFDEMQRLWEHLGRQPSSDEMRKLGHISVKAYSKRFGNWTKAVLAFCADRNAPEETPPNSEQLIPDSLLPPIKSDGGEFPPRATSAADCDAQVVFRTTPRFPSDRLRWRVLERDGHTCRSCGRGRTDGVKLHVDHVLAYSRGGETLYENLQTLCEPCNRGKAHL